MHRITSTHQLDPQLVDPLARRSVRVAHLHVLPQKLIVAQYQCLPATYTHITVSAHDMIATVGLGKGAHSLDASQLGVVVLHGVLTPESTLVHKKSPAHDHTF
jgi:hypothetical protein